MTLRKQFSRQGFTLVELLVVIAIIGVLVSLLLPAVQAARMAARRMQSQNNLKQVGLAMHNHHDVLNKLPAGYQAGYANQPPPIVDEAPGWAWPVFLLPYLEQSTVYDRINLDLSCWDPANEVIVRSPISTFICPGAPNQELTMNVKDAGGTTLAVFGRSHYLANNGQDETWIYEQADYSQVAGVGPFFRNSKVKFAQVTDGLTNTIFVGEHTTVSDKTWVGVVPGASSCPVDPYHFPFAECEDAATLVLCHSGPTSEEADVIYPPSLRITRVCNMYGPWPGAHVLMGDGSVRFVASSVNTLTWAALSSMKAGDIPGEF
jgi:prepilin-type N-terminal cleavage/methylation domain-containing protein